MKKVYCYRLHARDGSTGPWSVVDPDSTLAYEVSISLKNKASYTFNSMVDPNLLQWCKVRELNVETTSIHLHTLEDSAKEKDG